MILTFAKLQRLSGLTKPTAVKAWLRREGVAFLRDRDGRPFTTLDALNRKLQRATDDGFTLNDPEGGISEKRAMVSRRPQSVDRPNQGGRGAKGAAKGAARNSDRGTAANYLRVAAAVLNERGSQSGHEAGI